MEGVNSMSYKESTATSLTSAFYMRDFYKFNKEAMKSSTRKSYSTDEKSYEDSRALRRAAKRLGSYGFDGYENTDSVIATITAYVETYNNAITSASDSDDKDVQRKVKKLKDLTSNYADQLQNIGIKVEKDGTMTINESYLKDRSIDDLKKVFDPDNGFMDEVMSTSKKIFNKVHNSLYEQITGNGTFLNVSV